MRQVLVVRSTSDFQLRHRSPQNRRPNQIGSRNHDAFISAFLHPRRLHQQIYNVCMCFSMFAVKHQHIEVTPLQYRSRRFPSQVGHRPVWKSHSTICRQCHSTVFQKSSLRVTRVIGYSNCFDATLQRDGYHVRLCLSFEVSLLPLASLFTCTDTHFSPFLGNLLE